MNGGVRRIRRLLSMPKTSAGTVRPASTMSQIMMEREIARLDEPGRR
jgi:hypothetical protein